MFPTQVHPLTPDWSLVLAHHSHLAKSLFTQWHQTQWCVDANTRTVINCQHHALHQWKALKGATFLNEAFKCVDHDEWGRQRFHSLNIQLFPPPFQMHYQMDLWDKSEGFRKHSIKPSKPTMSLWTLEDLGNEEALTRHFFALFLLFIMSFPHKL